MELIFNNQEYQLHSFLYRINTDKKNDNEKTFQKVIRCNFKNVVDVEAISQDIINNFDGMVTVIAENQTFIFEDFQFEEISLFINEDDDDGIVYDIVFTKDVDINSAE